MRKAIAFLVAIIAIGVFFYACRKTDIPASVADKYSNLPTAVAEAARWYDKQMGMGGVSGDTGFINRNKPDWANSTVREVSNTERSVFARVHKQKYTKGVLIRELQITKTDGIFTSFIKEFSLKNDTTFIAVFTIRGRFLEEGYMLSNGSYVMTRKGGKKTIVLMGEEEPDAIGCMPEEYEKTETDDDIGLITVSACTQDRRWDWNVGDCIADGPEDCYVIRTETIPPEPEDAGDGGNQGGGSNGGGNQGGGSNGGSSNNDGAWTSNTVLFSKDPVGKKILNLTEELKCFSSNQTGTVTLYVDQPVPNSTASWSGSPLDPDVGHTWISISQGNITRYIGLYPKHPIDIFNTSDTAKFVADQGHHFDVSLTITNVSGSGISSLVNWIKGQENRYYDLNTNNCTSFAVEAFEHIGISLPRTNGSWTNGGGLNPGNLGQDIRNAAITFSGGTKNTTGGSVGNNSGQCQ
ncbi:MAG: hypothetical protein QM594_00965 [Niabella sp.]